MLLFDGYCGLCSGLVRFVLKQDKTGKIKMASIQSVKAQSFLKEAGLESHLPDSMVFIKKGKVWFESEAAIRLAAELGGFWKMTMIFLLFPRFLTDPVYRLVARNRYRIWGKTETCYLPDPRWTERFPDMQAD